MPRGSPAQEQNLSKLLGQETLNDWQKNIQNVIYRVTVVTRRDGSAN